MSDKTEEPTPKRLRKARADGDSPLSTFASQAVAFAAAVAIAPAAIASLTRAAAIDLEATFGRVAEVSPSVHVDAAALATSTLALAVPIVAVAAVTAAAVSLVQTGGVFATKRIVPDLAKLNAIAGFARLLSSERAIAVGRSFLFAAAVLWITYRALVGQAPSFGYAVGSVNGATTLAASLASGIARDAAIAGLFLAVLDVVVTRRSWLRRLRMSKADVKREHRESDGDPQLKSARERAHHEVLAAVTIANVAKASVVVVNPTHLACALKYDEKEGDATPTVVASGRGDLARKIVEAAHQYGVPVLRDVPLARALIELEVGDEIPEGLYEAVAEILREAWSSET